VALQDLNRRVIETLGPFDGAAHIEYIHGPAGFTFLEASARVGAGMIEEMVVASSGLNLWAEWARMELDPDRYRLPATRQRYAGVAICMTGQAASDLDRLAGPGVTVSVPKPYHVAMLVQSDAANEIAPRVGEQARKLEETFLAAR